MDAVKPVVGGLVVAVVAIWLALLGIINPVLAKYCMGSLVFGAASVAAYMMTKRCCPFQNFICFYFGCLIMFSITVSVYVASFGIFWQVVSGTGQVPVGRLNQTQILTMHSMH